MQIRNECFPEWFNDAVDRAKKLCSIEAAAGFELLTLLTAR